MTREDRWGNRMRWALAGLAIAAVLGVVAAFFVDDVGYRIIVAMCAFCANEEKWRLFAQSRGHKALVMGYTDDDEPLR
jgi:hypothetical protein